MDSHNRGSLPPIKIKHQSKGYTRWLGKRPEEDAESIEHHNPPKHYSMTSYIPQVSLDLGEDPISLTLPSIKSMSSIGGLSFKNSSVEEDAPPEIETHDVVVEPISEEDRNEYCSQLGFSDSTLQDIVCFSHVSEKIIEEPKPHPQYEPTVQESDPEEQESIKEVTDSKAMSEFRLGFSELSTTTTAVANSNTTPQTTQPTMAEVWTGLFDRACSAERKLFGVLGICALFQAVIQ